MKHTEAIDHGKLLTEFLRAEWDAMGETRGGWCRRNGISDSTVLRWEKGNTPDLANLVIVAEALQRPLWHLLVAAGYMSKDEMVAPPVPRERPSIEEAIRLDTTISEGEREALMKIHEAFAAVLSGRKRRVKVSGVAK